MAAAIRVTVLLIALLCIDHCYSATMPRNFDPRLSEEIVMPPKKRPFCNAFTGCGRKRSIGIPGMPLQELIKQRQMLEEDTYVPMSSDTENNIEDISRQIVNEAKLWQVIQDAAAEIARRKQRENFLNQ